MQEERNLLGSMMVQTRFHVRLLSKNSYFLYVVIGSTLSMCFLQVLAAYTTHHSLTSLIWIRAILVALWSMTIASVGIIGYQRFQGTLPYLFSGIYSPIEVLIPLLCALLVFSAGAFPCALLCSFIFDIPLTIAHPWWCLLGFCLVLCGFISVEAVCAALGVLTPRALIYEGVLNIPCLLGLGIFSLPQKLEFIHIIGRIIPGNDAIEIIRLSQLSEVKEPNYLVHIVISVMVNCVWLGIAYIAAHKAMKYALYKGTLNII